MDVVAETPRAYNCVAGCSEDIVKIAIDIMCAVLFSEIPKNFANFTNHTHHNTTQLVWHNLCLILYHKPNS